MIIAALYFGGAHQLQIDLKNLHGNSRFDYEETDEKTDNAEAKKVEMELRKLGYV